MSLAKHPKTLLVIFAESALEKQLIQDATTFGAQGYTVWDVRGASQLHTPHAQRRSGEWEAERSIEMKLVCAPEVADALAAHVLSRYAADYAVSLYFADVAVVRAEKF